MGKFNIGSFAASLNETVSKLDTNTEPQLQYIDIDQLDANEANFYDVSNLDTLADSIAMDGLQQPLVVTAGEDGRYTVISGHRRRAALYKLVEEDGREDLRRVPCLVRVYQSQALAELQLIMANSTARVLTSAEVMHQAKRMEDLLYQLKEEGYTFPGRMRAQVAEACQVSESKLARLKVIQDKLIVAWLARFEDGKISEDVAYTIAKMDQDYQVSLAEIFDARGYGVTKNTVEGYRLQLDEIAAIECVHGSACTNRERMIEHTGKSASPYWGTCKTCCASCVSRSTCEHVCPMVEEQVAQEAQARQLELEEERTKRDDAKAKELSLEEKVQAQRREEIKAIASRLVKAADLADLSDANKISMGRYTGSWSIKELREFAAGDFGNRKFAGWEFGRDDMERFIGAAKKLQCSVDYIMGLTDEIRPGQDQSQNGQWKLGKPTENGYYWAIYTGKISGGKLVWWQDDHWEPADVAMEITFRPMAWMPANGLPSWCKWERKEV